jgi:hypothetical protein
MIPGSNLLGLALSVIGKQRVEYFRYIGRKINDIGDDISIYADPAPMLGSVQAVDRNMYQYLGLDFQKRYVRFYACADLQDIARDRSSDQIEWAGYRYQLLSDVDWFNVDGWDGALCVQL